jgi:hypothetical protein
MDWEFGRVALIWWESSIIVEAYIVGIRVNERLSNDAMNGLDEVQMSTLNA